MANVVVSLSVSEELLREIDAAAAAEQLTRDEFFQRSIGSYLNDRHRWREIQAIASERARAAGILTEDDVEDLVDSVSE